jgi:hypothetical protein
VRETPTVTIGGSSALTVSTQTATQIISTVPSGLGAGTYALFVQIGNKANNGTTSVVSIGAVGPQGPQGAQGPTGATGATRAAGATGAMGPIGPIGPMRLKGETGVQGLQGPQGIGVLQVFDGNNKIIGPSLPGNSVLMVINGTVAQMSVVPAGFVIGVKTYYESHNCSGTALGIYIDSTTNFWTLAEGDIDNIYIDAFIL